MITYPKPKILWLDIQNPATATLRAKGFNITEGTLGRPYRVTRSSDYQPLIGIAKAGNLTEQEIVVMDMKITSYLSAPEGQKHRPDREIDLFGKCDKGFLDPRVRAVVSRQKDFERIYSNGGAFIIFAEDKTRIELSSGRLDYYGNFVPEQQFHDDIWDLLDDLSIIDVAHDDGREMTVSEIDSPLVPLLAKYLPDSEFTCVLSARGRNSDKWDTLASNKFGSAVALALCEGVDGTIIVLPQLKDKAGFLSELLTTVLPEICPHLFPFIEKGKWTHQPQYELPLVRDLLAQQMQIREKAQGEIAALTTQIEQERQANGWMHDLLTGTDTPLVEAVKNALGTLGFTKVVDVDEIQDKEGKPRREDLQVHDKLPTLIVDIKGLGGFPADSDANQSFKHATLRIKEWKNFEVQALTLINHQRHLPPMDRDNAMPFRQEILDIADEHDMGLMTTWDLYRLVRGAIRWGWKPEHTCPVLYRLGRIEPFPAHYELVGTVAHMYPEAGVVSIQLDAIGLSKGDRIAFELDVEFEEQDVTSLQVDKSDVQTATVGMRAGIKTKLDRATLKVGTRVFVVRPKSEV